MPRDVYPAGFHPGRRRAGEPPHQRSPFSSIFCYKYFGTKKEKRKIKDSFQNLELNEAVLRKNKSKNCNKGNKLGQIGQKYAGNPLTTLQRCVLIEMNKNTETKHARRRNRRETPAEKSEPAGSFPDRYSFGGDGRGYNAAVFVALLRRRLCRLCECVCGKGASGGAAHALSVIGGRCAGGGRAGHLDLRHPPGYLRLSRVHLRHDRW